MKNYQSVMLKQKIILRKDSIVTAYLFHVTLKHSKRNSKRNKLREKNKKRAFLKREKNPEKEKKKTYSNSNAQNHVRNYELICCINSQHQCGFVEVTNAFASVFPPLTRIFVSTEVMVEIRSSFMR